VVGRGQGWGVGFAFAQRRQDNFQHALDVLQHIVVPEAKDAIAMRTKVSGSLRITDNVIRLIMLPAIDLDDQASLMAGEVCKVRTDSGLPPEMGSLNWQAPQMPPKFAFRFDHVAAQSTSARDAWV
jgi:hypothetical protein